MIVSAFQRFERWLEGWPNGALTVALLVGALVIIYIALRGSAFEKSVVAAYIFFP